MSEEILKALMQLFAVVTYPGDATNPRRAVVEAFLKKQLNSHRAIYYLGLFDLFYQEHQSKFVQKERFNRRISATSVRALKIASTVNDELTYYQKLVVIIQLVEFLNSASGVDPVERDFIDNVAQILHINVDDYNTIIDFIVENKLDALSGDQYLLVSDQDNSDAKIKTWRLNHFHLKMYVAAVKSANILLMRFLDDAELTINGQLADPYKVHLLRPGATVRGAKNEPIYYSDLLSLFLKEESPTHLAFEVDNLFYKFNKRQIGLFPLSFVGQSGNMVGIMGDSGAGKTTLVNLLCGIYKPTQGTVRLNGIDIHKNPEKVEGLIGYVSQDDLLIEDLTVFQNLFFNAKLCFDNLTEEEIRQKVLKLLESLGLFDARNMKVGSPLNKNISGGQRKRLNIALELIREPAILFLDEPTSGLSSRDSENILDLLKELSAKGKLVFVVIHQPSSDVFKMFNHLLVLDTGGYLIYNGDALECIPYFKQCMHHANYEEGECPSCGNVNAEQVLSIVHTKVIDEYGSFTNVRKVEPSEWYERYKNNFVVKKDVKGENIALPKLSFKIPSRLKQFLVFLQRDTLSKLSNKQYLAINGFEAPILALFLSLLFRYFSNGSEYTFANNPNLSVYIIISVIIAFFVGLTMGAEEIINDRKILNREAFLNLSRLSYIVSKVVLLGVISIIQMLLFVVIGNSIMGIKDMNFYYWIILFSTSVFANLLGLVISDTLKKTVNIYILIPFLVIPQLILSGIFVSYDRLNPSFSDPSGIPWYGEFIVSRWSFEALAVNQYVNNSYQQPFFELEMTKSKASFMRDFWVPAMQNNLMLCNDSTKDNKQAFTLLRNEINTNYLHSSVMPFEFPSQLNDNQLSNDKLDALRIYLLDVKSYYKKVYNNVDTKIDKIRVDQVKTEELKQQSMKLRNDYYNESLERLLKGTDRFFGEKIIEYKGQLIQKTDPIFKEPGTSFFSAHYYSPHKYIFNYKVPTFWANLMVIGGLCLIMFVVLYFRGLVWLFSLFNKIRLFFMKVLYLDR